MKPCPFCGNKDIKMQVLISQDDILIDMHYCKIDFICLQCRTVKSVDVCGADEEECIKSAIECYNTRKGK